MPFLSRNRRPRRSGEWTSEHAVTFIVTLAATGSVTLAARRAGMSRKSAYALRTRDPAFAYAWAAAMRAVQEPALSLSKEPALSLSKGDKVDEVKGPPVPPRDGNASPSCHERERAFSGFVAALRDWNPERTSASALNP